MHRKTAYAPRISVAMATYNGAKYLREQLHSLAAQTLTPSELVVTDDGSTDGTLQILEAFAQGAPFPVHIHRNEQRLGYRDNFLKAARLCTGELIAFCDQDDLWSEDKLRIVSPVFADAEVELAVHDATLVTEDLEPIGDIRIADCAVPFSVQYGFAMVFRADLPFTGDIARPHCDRSADGSRFAHDQWICFLGASLGKYRHIRQPLVRYRQHDSNTCGYGSGMGARRRLAAVGRTQASRYLRLNKYALERARTLRELIRTIPLSARRRKNAEESAIRWERHAKLLLRRAEINGDKAIFLARQKHFVLAVLQLGYSRKHLGHRALLKDAFVAVFGARVLSRALVTFE